MTTTSLASLDVEISNERMDELVKASESEDGTELATAAAEIPRLIIEVNRLRQERDERVSELKRAKRVIEDKNAYIETLRPRAQAEYRLRELEDRISSIVAQAERVTRERDEQARTVVALEKRVQTLLEAMVELARGTGAEKYAQEAQEQRERAQKAEAELAELKRDLGE